MIFPWICQSSWNSEPFNARDRSRTFSPAGKKCTIHINKNCKRLRDGLQKLIQQINHASCPAILYEDIQVGTQDAKCTKWLKLMGYPVYVSVASLRTSSPWVPAKYSAFGSATVGKRTVASATHSEVNKVAEDAARRRDSGDFSLPLLRNQAEPLHLCRLSGRLP